MNLTENQLAHFVHQENEVREKLYDSFIKENLQAIAMVDNDLRFVIANAAFCNLLGMNGTHRLNKFHVSVLPFSKSPDFQSLLESLMKNEIPRFEIETTFNIPGLGLKCLRLKMTRLMEDGLFTGGMLLLNDVTQTRKKQELLEQKINDLKGQIKELQKEKAPGFQFDNFARQACHDLKEPVRMMGSFAQLLERRYAEHLDGTGKEYLSFIQQGVNNMNSFIDNLMDFSILEEEEDQKRLFSLEGLFLILKNDLSKKISKTKAIIEIGTLPQNILGNKEKLKTLFRNVIENGLKFQKKSNQPILKIKCRDGDTHWHITIADNGIGIRKEFHDSIFQLFTRLHSRSEFDGTGLGLALCQRIVQQHEGKIWVDSEIDEGSTFHLTIKK